MHMPHLRPFPPSQMTPLREPKPPAEPMKSQALQRIVPKTDPDENSKQRDEQQRRSRENETARKPRGDAGDPLQSLSARLVVMQLGALDGETVKDGSEVADSDAATPAIIV